MGSLTFSEIATIAVIVLIVFGPKRLPELARRAGVLMSKVTAATRELREELREEYQDTLAPLEEVRRDLEAARREVTEAAKEVGADLEAAGKDVTEAARDVGSDLEGVGQDISDAARSAADDVERGAGEPQEPRVEVAGTTSDSPPEPLEDVRRQLQAARDEITAEAGAGPGEDAEAEDT
jgi:sec-independent protein translocase protein TatB